MSEDWKTSEQENDNYNMSLWIRQHKWQSCECLLAQKSALPKKHDLIYFNNAASETKEEPTTVFQRLLSVSRDMDITTVSQNSPAKQKHSKFRLGKINVQSKMNQ